MATVINERGYSKPGGELAEKLNRFFGHVRTQKERIVLSAGAGSMHATAATQILSEYLWHYIDNFDWVFPASGSSLVLAPLCTGKTPDDVERSFLNTDLSDYIDKRELMAGTWMLENLQRLWHHNHGLSNGEKLRALLHDALGTESFEATMPKLFIPATPMDRDHNEYAQLFGEGYEPEVPISFAAAASAAHPFYFRDQMAPSGARFSDVAAVEPLPTISVLRHFRKEWQERHPDEPIQYERLLIIAIMISYDFIPPGPQKSFFRKLGYQWMNNTRMLVTNQLHRIKNAGAQVILIHPNMDRLHVRFAKGKFSPTRWWYAPIDIARVSAYAAALETEIYKLLVGAIDAYFENPYEKLIVSTHDDAGHTQIRRIRGF